jgi:heme-degrading monooxygenase HmoA
MFVATNRITIQKGNGEDLEDRFRRQGGVESQPGFLGFEMWKLEREEETEEYLIVTHWESGEAHMGWVRSDSFRQAHAGPHPEYLQGPGEFKTYDVRFRFAPQGS